MAKYKIRQERGDKIILIEAGGDGTEFPVFPQVGDLSFHDLAEEDGTFELTDGELLIWTEGVIPVEEEEAPEEEEEAPETETEPEGESEETTEEPGEPA